jgi:predicted DNA-binding protein YlxM (UPF0122 family)
MNHIWTKEDEDFVRQHYPYKMSIREIAEKYNVSTSCVRRFVDKLDLPPCPIELRSQRVSAKTRYWTKKRIVQEIHRLARTEQINSSYVQKNTGSFFNAACLRFGSWKDAIQAAGFDYDEVNLYAFRKNWSSNDILDEIKSLHQQGEDLKASFVRDKYAALFNAARRDPKFGTWEATIEAAGLSYDEILGERWGNTYQGADGFVYPSDIEGRVGDRLYKLKYRKRIADYHNQVRVSEGRAWTCDFVVELIDGGQVWLEVDGLGVARRDGIYGDGHEKIEFYEENGLDYAIVRTPKQAEEIIKNSRDRGQNLALEYDAPRNLVELGGNRYTDQELLDELKRVCEQLGRTPTQKEMNDVGKIRVETIKRRLGWDEACAQVGFPIKDKSDLILEDILRVIETLGCVPTQSKYVELGKHGQSAIVNHLSSYDNAVKLLGFEPPQKTISWNPEKVIKSIQELRKQTSMLSASTLRKIGQAKLYYAAIRYFDTWENAMKAANFPVPNTRKLQKWAQKYDACIECGETRLRHAGKGLCSSCYSRKRRNV